MNGVDPRVVRIANCSGFYGDRLSAAREMVLGGPIDVLTGDWLAELTLLILARARSRGRPGYATTFLAQMRDVLGECLARGIKVVSNAGGLDPAGLAAAVAELGTEARVAYVEGDDLMRRLDGLDLVNLDTGERLADVGAVPITANAYLGGWGIAAALELGADVVVTGRVTDAALVVGPAAWYHGWSRRDWDRLAGAVVAGHVVECGAQATGGNFAFFQEVPELEHPGFPIAEVAADGSAVITKHEGTGGLVSVDTVTAQLLYEIGGVRYPNPDVTARFDTIRLAPDGPDRVRISGVRGEPPPPTTKVCVNYEGGFRNTMTLGLCGLDVPAKADLARRTIARHVPVDRFDSFETVLYGSGVSAVDPATNEEAIAFLQVTVTSRDEALVGRAFANAITEMTLASYPGLFNLTPPSGASAYGVYWPTTVDAALPAHTVVFEGRRFPVPPVAGPFPAVPPVAVAGSPSLSGPASGRVPLGRVAGARSGDKGGNANVGVWGRTDEVGWWLTAFLTPTRVKELLPEAANLEVEVFPLPNLRAVNIVIHGLLGRGVASSSRLDPQAKSLGEWLRSRLVPVPDRLLDG